MSTDLFMLLPIISILFSLIPVVAAIFVVYAFWKQGKECNAYLKEILEEVRRKESF